MRMREPSGGGAGIRGTAIVNAGTERVFTQAFWEMKGPGTADIFPCLQAALPSVLRNSSGVAPPSAALLLRRLYPSIQSSSIPMKASTPTPLQSRPWKN